MLTNEILVETEQTSTDRSCGGTWMTLRIHNDRLG